MPRRRSGLTDRTLGTAAAGSAAIVLAVAAAAGCQAGQTDIGCQITRQIVLPDTTPLPLLSQIRIDRLGDGLVIFGADATAVRWTVIDAAGTVGAEQAVALPAGTLHAYYAAAGATAPGDTVIVGALVPAANGTDADLRFFASPIDDGTAAGVLGTPVVTFGGGADPRNALPMIAMGTSATAMYAGAAWLDPASGLPSYAFIDGQAQTVGQTAFVESEAASSYSCLGFSPGKQELTISYQKGPVDPVTGPTWLIADVQVGGVVSLLKLNVAQPNGTMGCAHSVLYDPMTTGASPEYAIVWQDPSGSWLSVYYGAATGVVKSFPFASSTDFGGPDLQPPLVGVAAFNSDFGVLVQRPHSVEMWRVDRAGNRRSGSLIYPSLEGNISGASAVARPDPMVAGQNLLSSTYADLTGMGMGRRLVVDAACY